MNEINTWRTIPIFISSTFKDMQAERDYLNTFLLHDLNEEFESYKIDFKLIDLRWGVDTISIDEEEREAKVLKVCLDSISNNRPFFIALLGDRYGWVPPSNCWKTIYNSLNDKEKSLLGDETEGKSVTELEILFGALGNVKDILSRSLFFFRTIDSSTEIQENKKHLYIERDSGNKNKLLSLKRKIQQICENKGYTKAIHHYKLTWEDNKLKGIEDWGKLVFENLCNEIKEEIESTKITRATSQYELEMNKLNRFIYYQKQRFVGRENLLKESIGFLLSSKKKKIITAFSGAGKSSFMCELYKKLLSQANAQQIILFHSAGISQYAHQAANMLQSWSMQICKKLGVEYNEVDNSNDEQFTTQAKEQFLSLVELANNKVFDIVILVDALDRFQQNNLAKYMLWLPKNVSLLCTTLPGHEVYPLKMHSSLQVEEMPLFSEIEAREMLVHICKIYNKDINSDILKIILQKKTIEGIPAYTSPLWLSLVSSILFGLNADDFDEMEQKTGNSSEEKMQCFFYDLAESFSANTEELFLTLLTRASKFFGKLLTLQSMKYIALSQNGLREKDLSALLNDNWDLLRFTSLRRWFRYLILESESKQWHLGHIKLSNALDTLNENENISLHKNIAKHFLSLPENDLIKKQETVFHLIKGDMKEEIVEYCVDIEDYSNSYVIDSILNYYKNDNSVLIYLANCIKVAKSNEDAILYAGKLVLGLNNRISKTNQTALIAMGVTLFKNIDHKKCDIICTRWIGETSNILSTACEHIGNYESMLYFVEIQEYCHKLCVEHYKDDKDIQIFKNSLAMAFYKLGNYFTKNGNKKRAFEYFNKMSNI